MKVVKIKKIENCFETEYAKDLLFDRSIEKDFIDYIGSLGKLIYITQFDKPFYQVIVRGKYTLKGTQGNKTMRVLLPFGSDSEHVDSFIEFAEKYE